MFQNSLQQSVPNAPARGWQWTRVLLVGLVLFVITILVMLFTDNSNLFPTVILIGNFLIPVVFVAFLYDHQNFSTLSAGTVAASFCVGGVLGVLGASILEAYLIPVSSNPTGGLSLSSAMLVGLIEEGSKIIAVIFLARKMNHTSAMDGLLLGGAVGMGFAALESTGYAFSAFLLSRGHIGPAIIETIIRGVIAPFGHGTWTAILGAVLFRESAPRHFRLTGLVLLTYLFVSVLHGFWDGLPQMIAFYLIVPPGIHISVITVLLSIIGITTLAMTYRQALFQHMRRFVQWSI